MMHSNPYDYGDYEEIWSACPDCDGTPFKIEYQENLIEEDEIPY